MLVDSVAAVLDEAEQLRQRGEFGVAIDRLTAANRASLDARIECKLVDVRLEAAAAARRPDVPVQRSAIAPEGDGGEIVEVDPDDMTVEALRSGWARSGCLLVRGLVPPDRAAQLIGGIDSALAAFDACDAGESFDPGWYTARPIRDRIGSGPAIHRINRGIGALWTVFSPRMVCMLFDAIEALGVGQLMTEFLGERPFLSANKCTLRRVPPADLFTGWHQDGAFLGDRIGSVNVWMSLTPCGVDSPGLDLVPKRFDGVLDSGGDGAVFRWSLSDEAVADAAGSASIVRPQFGAGDVLLFDHRLVHRTASSGAMTRDRYAIESWFFAPSAYPDDQVPLFF
jgi:hypothetical protein